MMSEPTLEAITKRLFSEARSFGGWLPQTLSPETLLQLYSLAQWGPTSMNSQPMRLKFAQSDSSRKKLSTCVDAGNVGKVLSAPVVAIIGMDLNFPATLTELFPHKAEAKNYYIGNAEKTFATALRNSSLQGAYLMLAARLLGLDCGPMSGFDHAAVDRAFWSGSAVKTNFLCALGYGDHASLKPRGKRYRFEEIAEIV